MGRTGKWILAILGTVGLVLGAMQNCSQVDFQAVQGEAEAAKTSANNVFVVGSEPVQLPDDDDTDSDDDRTPDADSRVTASGGSGPSGDGDGDQGSEGFVESSTDDGSSEDGSSDGTSDDDSGDAGTLACGSLQVRDVIIDILAIEVRAGQGQTYQLNIGSGPADLLDLANGIDFIPDRNLSITQLRILLGSENYVLTVDDQIYPLQTTNQQNSGLIALLDGRTDLAKDVTYHLTLDFDPRFQVKRAGEQCQLHPNVSARIE